MEVKVDPFTVNLFEEPDQVLRSTDQADNTSSSPRHSSP